MVNFGLLTAEICWRVWGTPANFNGFRALAALLHGVSGSSGRQPNWGVEQMAPPMFGRATITLGIGPHSSYLQSCTELLVSHLTTMPPASDLRYDK